MVDNRLTASASRLGDDGVQRALETSPLLDSLNPTVRRAIATARQVARSDATVLLLGESGTGKNVLAAAIHSWSRRAGGPFVTLTCTTLGPRLLEPELVDDARDDEVGPLARAAGGTLFLDDVGQLPPRLQSALAHCLGEERFHGPVDDGRLRFDARIIAATSRRLDADVASGRFREDLFFQLSVVTIVLPPLRERREDVPALADHVLAQLAARHRRGVLRLSPEVRAVFAAHRWPGNARELFNTIERAVVLSSGDVIALEHLPDNLLDAGELRTRAGIPPIALSLDQLERQQIARVLRDSKTLREAATRLGIDPSTLWRKRKRYGLDEA